jgi:hypothetical protein
MYVRWRALLGSFPVHARISVNELSKCPSIVVEDPARPGGDGGAMAWYAGETGFSRRF